jgi:hypothetical protein
MNWIVIIESSRPVSIEIMNTRIILSVRLELESFAEGADTINRTFSWGKLSMIEVQKRSQHSSEGSRASIHNIKINDIWLPIFAGLLKVIFMIVDI